MQATATAKYVRMAPRKVRFVLDTVRGKYASDAFKQLQFTPNYAAVEIAKVLKSAVANAENNFGMNPDYLKIVRCFVDVGPTLKRVQPRAQGRAYRILKRTSHITVIVEEGTPPPTTRQRELDIKKRGKKPPLRAAIATPTAAAPVVDETPVAVEDTDEQTTAAVTELTAGEAAPTDATASAAAEEPTEAANDADAATKAE